MNRFFPKRKIWWAIAAVLLVGNVYLHWPKTSGPTAVQGPPTAPDGANMEWQARSPEEMRERVEEAISKLPEVQQDEIRKRMEADRAFFESLKDLAQDQRSEKLREHFASQPHIPGMEGMGPHIDGGGFQGDGGHGDPAQGHIPDPSTRYGMDKHIADSNGKDSAP